MVKPEGVFPEKYIKRSHRFAHPRGIGDPDCGAGCGKSAFGLGRSCSRYWLFVGKVNPYHPACVASPFEC